jgi:hypothetical protein
MQAMGDVGASKQDGGKDVTVNVMRDSRSVRAETSL